MAAAPCPPWVLLRHPHNHRAGSARLPWPRCEVGSQEANSSKVSRGQRQGGLVGLGRTPEPLCPAVAGVGCQHSESPGHPLAGMEEVLPAELRQNNAPCVQPQRALATLPTGRKRRRGHGLRGAPTPIAHQHLAQLRPETMLPRSWHSLRAQRRDSGVSGPLAQSKEPEGSPMGATTTGLRYSREELGANHSMANGWGNPSSGTVAQAGLARGLLGGTAPKGVG